MKIKNLLLAPIIGVLLAFSLPQLADACTGLLVGKKASTDGSVMISYAADSHVLYGELYHWPARDWPKGTMRKVVEWDTYTPLGEIPEVAHTYAVLGNMNEHQLAITESTWGGRKELVNPEGLIDYGSLIYITLQRAKTAREAIKVMTNLVEKYGYHSSGESFSIADKEEAWVMELIGKGPGRKGAVWVAMRIPDNAISAHANQSRIQQIRFNDPENCIYSKDVISFAREKGYFKGADKDFSFQKAYNPWTFSGLRGCEARVWAFFNKFCEGMDKYLPLVMGDATQQPMPLYVVPKRKLSIADVRNMMRDHYEGTPMDMSQDIGAGPNNAPYRWRPMDWEVDGKHYFNERAIATQQTGFVLVAQMRNWLPDEVGGILWFGVDDANTAVFTPMYASINEVPECYRHGNGDMMNFSWTSAFWIHNWVANMAYNRYDLMIDEIREVQVDLESSFDKTIATIDTQAKALLAGKSSQEARKFLTDFCAKTAVGSTTRWKKLGEYLLVRYMDGNRKKLENGKFKDNGYGMSASPDFMGYNERYYRSIVTETGDKFLTKE
ncbi:peptidase, C69 family [Bacteroidales bacterium KA00251]|nr:peptidase, C69 family [Bacteroidales bacterium KA00251]